MFKSPEFLASLGVVLSMHAAHAQTDASMRPLNPTNRPVDSSLFVPAGNSPRAASNSGGRAVLQAPLPANRPDADNAARPSAAKQRPAAQVAESAAAAKSTALSREQTPSKAPADMPYERSAASAFTLPAAKPLAATTDGSLPLLKTKPTGANLLLQAAPAAAATPAALNTSEDQLPLDELVPIERVVAQSTEGSAAATAGSSSQAAAAEETFKHPELTIKAEEIQKPVMANVPLSAENKPLSWFAPKLLHGTTAGWQVVTAAHLPAHKLSVSMQDGSRRELEITPMLLGVADGPESGYFQVIEPGFEPKRAYRQVHTVAGALEQSIADLGRSAQQVDQAARQLEQLLQALPAPQEADGQAQDGSPSANTPSSTPSAAAAPAATTAPRSRPQAPASSARRGS